MESFDGGVGRECSQPSLRHSRSTHPRALALSVVAPLNTTITINCLTHAVTRDDTGEACPGVVTPSDVGEWLRLNAGANALRYVEAGGGGGGVTTQKPGAGGG